MQDRCMRAERRIAVRLDMLAADLGSRGDVPQIDEPRASHAAIQRYAVDGFRVVEEVKRRVHVGAGVHAEIDAADLHGRLADKGDVHRAVAREDGRTGAHRLAEIDDASGDHPISVMLIAGRACEKSCTSILRGRSIIAMRQWSGVTTTALSWRSASCSSASVQCRQIRFAWRAAPSAWRLRTRNRNGSSCWSKSASPWASTRPVAWCSWCTRTAERTADWR